MKFEFLKAIQILGRTPALLHNLLHGLADDWIFSNEGAGTWSPFDIVGHLIVCENTDFMNRVELMLSDSAHKVFAPVDMTAQFEANKGKTIADLLKEFEQARKEHLTKLAALHLTATDFQRSGVHPTIGKTTLGELLATWVAHDLNHVAQITRVMAKQYKEEVGPFTVFLSILK